MSEVTNYFYKETNQTTSKRYLQAMHLSQFQLRGFLFGKIHSFDAVDKLFLSSHFAIEEGAIFENKFFMFF